MLNQIRAKERPSLVSNPLGVKESTHGWPHMMGNLRNDEVRMTINIPTNADGRTARQLLSSHVSEFSPSGPNAWKQLATAYGDIHRGIVSDA